MHIDNKQQENEIDDIDYRVNLSVISTLAKKAKKPKIIKKTDKQTDKFKLKVKRTDKTRKLDKLRRLNRKDKLCYLNGENKVDDLIFDSIIEDQEYDFLFMLDYDDWWSFDYSQTNYY